MKTIPVQPLTEQSFARYGTVITTQNRPYGGEEGIYRWYEKQAEVTDAKTVSINLLTAVERPFTCQKFEMHDRTTETILPLTGDMIVAGIPAGDPTADRLEAFYVPQGTGICWGPGVWHFAPYSLRGDTTCAIIFRHGTGGDDAVIINLPEEVGIER